MQPGGHQKRKLQVSWALTPQPVKRQRRVSRWSEDRPGEDPPIVAIVAPPVGSAHPSRAIRFPHKSLATSTRIADGGMLPQDFPPSTTRGVMEALQTLMPGPGMAEHATRMNAQEGVPHCRRQNRRHRDPHGCVHPVTETFARNNIIGQKSLPIRGRHCLICHCHWL